MDLQDFKQIPPIMACLAFVHVFILKIQGVY